MPHNRMVVFMVTSVVALITPLMPLLLWLLLDRAFINQLWMEMVMAGAAEAGDKKKSADS